MLLSDRILAENQAVFAQMLDHQFVADICGDNLPTAVFHRYLAYESTFVETAISIFAYATIVAPNIATQRWLIGIQDALANTQIPYFEDTFQRLKISHVIHTPAEVRAFDRGLLAIAQGGQFLEIITAMFAAEWMYWTWCRQAAEFRITDPDIKTWVDLHTEPVFTAQAQRLKDTIDFHAPDADATQLSAIFDRVMRLEIDFHTAAYSPAVKE